MAASVFRFRAQAALDLRGREEDEAQRDLARAQRDRDAARVRLDEAIATHRRAQREAADVAGTAGSVATLQWYRFWIVRLDKERAMHDAAVAACDTVVAQAAVALMAARQRRQALDRFKDKARHAFNAAAAAAERQLIDELATRRFATARLAHKGA